MQLLFVVAAIVVLLAAAGSVHDAVRLLRSQEGSPRERRRLWGLLAIGIIGGGYLSVGSVYASATTRWYGAPMPVVIFQIMGGKWADFVGPFSLIAPFYNLVFWLGLAFAPVTLPNWWRRSGRAWLSTVTAASAWGKAAWAGGTVLVLGLPPLLGYLTTSRHIITVTNQSAFSLPDVSLSVGTTNRYRGTLAPGEERIFDFEQSVTAPYILSRRDGNTRVTMGKCDHTNGRVNRYLVTISGESGNHLECAAQAP